MAWEYSDKTKQLFQDAMAHKSGTHLGEIKNADAVGEDGSIVCGDAMKLFFNVAKDKNDPTKDQIIEIKYQTFGCTSAIASSEALCQMIEERKCTPLEALTITNQDIVNHLGGLPNQKIHCSVMGAEALEQAVRDWANKRGVDLEKHAPQLKDNDHLEEDEGTVICSCFSITEPFLKRKIKELNLKTVDDVKNATKAGGSCSSCIDKPGGVRDILKSIWGEESQAEQNNDLPENIEELITNVIEEKVRPALKLHGGDIDIIKIKGLKVYCELEGSCSHCAGAAITLENVVSKQLKELVHPDIVVINL